MENIYFFIFFHIQKKNKTITLYPGPVMIFSFNSPILKPLSSNLLPEAMLKIVTSG